MKNQIISLIKLNQIEKALNLFEKCAIEYNDDEAKRLSTSFYFRYIETKASGNIGRITRESEKVELNNLVISILNALDSFEWGKSYLNPRVDPIYEVVVEPFKGLEKIIEKKENLFYTEIIPPKDSNEIFKLQKYEVDRGFSVEARNLRYYESHFIWLRKAIKDVEKGERIAFGVYSLTETGKEVLVASSIIKQADYSIEVGIKNFYVYDSQLLKVIDINKQEDSIEKNRSEIRGLLIKRIEFFCRSRGFRKLKVIVPTFKEYLVKTLIDSYFTVSHKAELDYLFERGYYIYVLQKQLMPIYNGDPMALNYMVNWFFQNFYALPEKGLQFLVNEKSEIDIKGYLFETELKNQIGQIKEFNYKIKGEVQILQNQKNVQISDVLSIFNVQSQLKVLFTIHTSRVIKNACKKEGIQYLDYKLIRPVLDNSVTDYLLNFKPEDLNGILTTTNHDLKSQIVERTGGFVFLFYDGFGSTILQSVLENREKQFKLYFSSTYKNEGSDAAKKIWGYVNIKGGFQGSLDDAKKYWYDESDLVLFKLKDFLYTSRYYDSNKEKDINITAFEVGGVTQFVNPIPIDLVLSEKLKNMLKGICEYGVESPNYFYLDNISNKKILSLLINETTQFEELKGTGVNSIDRNQLEVTTILLVRSKEGLKSFNKTISDLIATKLNDLDKVHLIDTIKHELTDQNFQKIKNEKGRKIVIHLAGVKSLHRKENDVLQRVNINRDKFMIIQVVLPETDYSRVKIINYYKKIQLKSNEIDLGVQQLINIIE